jgi:hypothetical protein
MSVKDWEILTPPNDLIESEIPGVFLDEANLAYALIPIGVMGETRPKRGVDDISEMFVLRNVNLTRDGEEFVPKRKR